MTQFALAGTVSAGTLLPEDLIPKFTDALEGCLGIGAPDVTNVKGYAALVREARAYQELLPRTRQGTLIGLSELVDELQDALNDCAPEGWYFGTLEGDGAEFGFWRAEDDAPTFTTQEGAVFGMEGATCPNGHPSSLEHRTFPSGYFRCPTCNIVYDEPTFDPAQYVRTEGED